MKSLIRLSVAILILAAAASAPPAQALIQHIPNYCNDPCDVEGDYGTCLYYRNGALAKTSCTCTSGHWAC